MSAPATTRPTNRTRSVGLLIPVVVGTGFAVTLGVYGRLHEPTGYGVNLAGFTSGLAAKAWLTTAAAVLAIGQLVTAGGMWGRLGLADRAWVAPLHRWAGRLALVAAVPVAMHCLYSLGLQPGSPRALLHSLLGCLFFGAFATKMLALRGRGLPGWALPVFGGLVFAALVGLWLTSALWFFTTFGITR